MREAILKPGVWGEVEDCREQREESAVKPQEGQWASGARAWMTREVEMWWWGRKGSEHTGLVGQRKVFGCSQSTWGTTEEF